MSKNKVVRLNLSDRVAELAAHLMMQKLNWSRQPKLLQTETPQLLEYGSKYARFLVKFPLLRDKTFVYKVAVSLYGGEGKWRGGHVYARHGSSAQEYIWFSELRVVEVSEDRIDEVGDDLLITISDPTMREVGEEELNWFGGGGK